MPESRIEPATYEASATKDTEIALSSSLTSQVAGSIRDSGMRAADYPRLTSLASAGP